MSVKKELTDIGYRIVTEEPVPAMRLFGTGTSVRWYNTTEFNPGLCVRAVFHGDTVGPKNDLQAFNFVLVRPEGAMSLAVPMRMEEETFENEYGALILDGFRQYVVKRHPLVPFGLEDISRQPSNAAREALSLLAANELLVA